MTLHVGMRIRLTRDVRVFAVGPGAARPLAGTWIVRGYTLKVLAVEPDGGATIEPDWHCATPFSLRAEEFEPAQPLFPNE